MGVNRGSAEYLTTAKPSQITGSDIIALCERAVPESFTLEYKREFGDGHKVLRAVASMANTYGGVVVVGVDENRERDLDHGHPGAHGIVDVDRAVRGRLIDMCWAQLEPPMTPEVIEVETSPGKLVLLVRVSAGLVDRPVVYRDQVFVRSDHGTRRADRSRLLSLLREANDRETPNAGFASMGHRNPSSHRSWSEEPRPFLLIRGVMEARCDGRAVVTSSARNSMQESLGRSELRGWASGLNEYKLAPFALRGPSSSSRFEVHASASAGAERPSVGIECSFEIPRSRGDIIATLDVILRRGQRGSDFVPGPQDDGGKLALADLARLLEAMLATLIDDVRPGLPDLVGSRALGRIIGPTVFVTTGNSYTFGQSVDVGDLYLVPGNDDGRGTELTSTNGANLLDLGERDQQIEDWMSQLLFDCHYASA